MRINELLTEDYLYHATFTKNVPSIIKKGLKQFQTSNWVKANAAGGTDRYNKEAGLFSFEHPEDAITWAQRMNFDFNDDVSIVRMKTSSDWEQDPSKDITLAFGKGRAMRTSKNVNPSDIIDVFHLKDFGNALSHNMTRDEWLAMVSRELEK